LLACVVPEPAPGAGWKCPRFHTLAIGYHLGKRAKTKDQAQTHIFPSAAGE